MFIWLLSGKALDYSEKNQADYYNTKSDHEWTPKRGKYPPPRPCNDVAQFKGDKDERKDSEERESG